VHSLRGGFRHIRCEAGVEVIIHTGGSDVQHEFTAGLDFRFFGGLGDIRLTDLISPQPFQPMGRGRSSFNHPVSISIFSNRSRDAYERRVATVSRILSLTCPFKPM